MSRRPASSFWEPLLVGLAVLTLTGCGGTPRETPAPQPAAQAEPAPAAESTPAAASDAPPVVASNAAPAASPSPVPAAAPTDAPPPAPAPDPSAKPAGKPADALQWLEDSQARQADYQRRIKEAEANLAIANAAVADWERTVLEFKNPLLPRPKLSPEDAQTIAGMDGGARLHWAEGRLEEARTARDAAQKTVNDVKANPPTN